MLVLHSKLPHYTFVLTVNIYRWAFGITLWEICTLGMVLVTLFRCNVCSYVVLFSGGYPYPSLGNGEILPFLMTKKRLNCPKNCSQELYVLETFILSTLYMNTHVLQIHMFVHAYVRKNVCTVHTCRHKILHNTLYVCLDSTWVDVYFFK